MHHLEQQRVTVILLPLAPSSDEDEPGADAWGGPVKDADGGVRACVVRDVSARACVRGVLGSSAVRMQIMIARPAQ